MPGTMVSSSMISRVRGAKGGKFVSCEEQSGDAKDRKRGVFTESENEGEERRARRARRKVVRRVEAGQDCETRWVLPMQQNREEPEMVFGIFENEARVGLFAIDNCREL